MIYSLNEDVLKQLSKMGIFKEKINTINSAILRTYMHIILFKRKSFV